MSSMIKKEIKVNFLMDSHSVVTVLINVVRNYLRMKGNKNGQT